MFKQYQRLGTISLIAIILIGLGIIPLRLAIATYQAPQPQGIFVLGGYPNREEAAAQLAKYYLDLDVWVSSGQLPKTAHTIFQSAGITLDRLHLDYRATDTVTNFTTLVAEFKRRRIQHLYIVTSDYHMPRAKAIATLVLGSQGITFTPVSVPSSEPPESSMRIVRDSGRSILWIMTGHTGASLGQQLNLEL